jgi:excinuclease ABC subunit C
MDNVLTGIELIKHYQKDLSNSPGVYRMIDSNHKTLYVGKAKNLKKRVSSYTKYSGHSLRIQQMIFATSSMLFLTTKNETEALLLEQNLIKQLKPKYNVQLRDDKSFPYIFISSEHDFPRLEKHRGQKKRSGNYYGPFASAGAVNRTLNTLQKVFLLRSCTDKEVKAGNRPCLNFHLKRCAGPCCGKISKSDYSKLVASADQFLRGRSEEVQKKLSKEMILASKEMNYELAASYRDRIKAISRIQSIQGINPQKVKEADIFALNFQSGQACVQVYFIRYNQNWGNRDYYPKVSSDMTKKEILEAFLGQFYLNRLPAKVILISNSIDNQNLLEKLFSEKLGKIVKIINPQKGEKKELVIDALRNAKEGLERKMAENSTQKNLLLKMADLLNLKNSPERIEVYDNSHIQGAYAVGAMVVSGPDGLMKSEYRKFNIKISELGNRDDTSMMQHVFSRRFKKKNTQDLKIPDVIILDGGKGQLSVIQNYLHDIGYGNIPIVAIAKGEKRNSGLEKFYHKKNIELEISNNDPLRYFLQRLRDEVHRYVIGAHRQKRSKSLMSTRLDEITGLGGIRRKNLLMRFGSTKEVSKASVNELQKVQGISRNLAEQIYNFFNTND